jgi:serine/threonine protein kinase
VARISTLVPIFSLLASFFTKWPPASFPFGGETSGVIFDAILNRAPLPPSRLNPEVPSQLEQIINKTLEKDRDVRCQSAAELRADLKRLRRELESGRSGAVSINPSSAATPAANATPLPIHRSYWKFSALAVAVLVVALFLRA